MAGPDRSAGRPGFVAARALAGRIGAELGRLSELTAEVQDAIAHLGPGRSPSSGAVRKMQHIDLITQSLQDLARLLAALAAELPEEAEVRSAPLSATLRLRDLDSIVTPAATDPLSAPGRSEDTFWL
ncbi:MAG: hypothetical protein ACKVPY_15415 [Paracoccaceae bacterium]